MKGTPKEIRATEAQAIARAVRRGQKKKVVVVRFQTSAQIFSTFSFFLFPGYFN
jgi:hypothetical protein